MCELSAYVAFNKATNGQTETQTRSLRGSFSTAIFNSDIQLCLLLFSFDVCSSVCRFTQALIRCLCRTFALSCCLVDIKKRLFLTSCMVWFVFLNASSHLCFRFFVTPRMNDWIYICIAHTIFHTREHDHSGASHRQTRTYIDNNSSTWYHKTKYINEQSAYVFVCFIA